MQSIHRRALIFSSLILFLVTGFLSGAGNAREKAQTPTKKPKAAQLPVFGKGPWKAAYAVYRDSYFEAVMDAAGILRVQIKNNGKKVGPVLSVGTMNAIYYVPKKRHTYYRRVISYNGELKPIMQPKSITLSGTLADGVTFYREFTFGTHSITYCATYQDPDGIEFPTSFRVITSTAASHKIPPKVEQPEREKILAGCLLKTRERVKGRTKTFRYKYCDTMRFHGAMEKATGIGPWSPRTFQIKPERLRDPDRFVGYIYPSFCPWQGYGFLLSIRNQTKRPQSKIIFSVR